MFEAIAASAKRLLGCQSTAVWRIEGDKAHLAAFTSVDPAADSALQRLSPLPFAEFSPLALVREGETAAVVDTEDSTPSICDIGRLRGYRSMLWTPLISNGAAIGAISVTRKNPGAFAQDDIQLLRTFADQAVIAIENARLFDEVQARTRDLTEALQQQTATADVLKVISRAAFDLDAVLEALAQTAARVCDADMAFIFRRDGDLYRFAAISVFPRSSGLRQGVSVARRAERGHRAGRCWRAGRSTSRTCCGSRLYGK